MFCRKCGNSIPSDSEFCPICGYTTVAAPEAVQSQPPSFDSPSFNDTPFGDLMPSPPSNENQAGKQKKNRNPKTKKRIIIAIVSIAVLIAVAVAACFIIDAIVNGNNAETYDSEITDSYDDGSINIDGNTCENLKYGGFVAQQGDYVYYGRDEIVKENIYSGEKESIHAGQSTVSNLAVCGNYVYFTSYFNSCTELCRIKTDGSDFESICEIKSSTTINLYFENKYVYYAQGTQRGYNKYNYSVVRRSADNIYSEENIYSLSESQRLEGVYQGYAVISDSENSSHFILCDVNTKACSDISYSDFSFRKDGKYHFDEGNVIFVDDNNVLVYNIESKSFTQKNKSSRMNITFVCDGVYYFDYNTAQIGSVMATGYTKLEYINGNDTRFNTFDYDSLARLNIVGDMIYYKNDYFSDHLARVDINGNNWSELY